ncbi:MAG: hypothetical protein AAFU65_12030 [Pseudomonadota bacterium]
MTDPNNAYRPPASNLGADAPIQIPEDIAKKIKHGWVAANVSAAMTLVVVVMMVDSDKWALVDVALILALSFGIYKKSRAAATVLLLYFIASQVLAIVETGKPNGLVATLIFLYFFAQAVVGTFQYHKFIQSHGAGRAQPETPPE